VCIKVKKGTKNNILKGSIAGVLGAAVAGGAAYLLSNKKTRKKIGKIVNTLEEKGGAELEKVLESVKSQQKKSQKKVIKVSQEISNKKKKL